MLTDKGKEIAKKLSSQLPDQYIYVALEVKKRIYPKTPEQAREMVHKEFPEYKDTYIKNDVE